MSSIAIEILGWIGSFCFAVCAIPQAATSWRLGYASGVSLPFLGLWLLGELCMIGYILPRDPTDWPLLFNYLGNLLCLLVILRYRLVPRRV